MAMKSHLVFALFFLPVLGFSSQYFPLKADRSATLDMRALDWEALAEDLVRNDNHVGGKWKSGDSWAGFLCDGTYHYDADLDAEVDAVAMDAESQTNILISADVINVKGNAYGDYRSSKTLCIPFRLGMKIGIDRVKAKARASLVKVGSENMIKVTILSTNFDTIHLGSSTPKPVEQMIERILNASLRKVWASRLGGWISDKVTEFINNQK